MRKFITSIALLALLGVSACDTTPEVTAPAPVFISFIRLAPFAPPAPQYETPEISATPAKEIWRPGYWDYDGSGYSWVPGELIRRPSPTAVWSSDTWIQHSYGWGFRPGYWQ